MLRRSVYSLALLNVFMWQLSLEPRGGSQPADPRGVRSKHNHPMPKLTQTQLFILCVVTAKTLFAPLLGYESGSFPSEQLGLGAASFCHHPFGNGTRWGRTSTPIVSWWVSSIGVTYPGWNASPEENLLKWHNQPDRGETVEAWGVIPVKDYWENKPLLRNTQPRWFWTFACTSGEESKFF